MGSAFRIEFRLLSGIQGGSFNCSAVEGRRNSPPASQSRRQGRGEETSFCMRRAPQKAGRCLWGSCRPPQKVKRTTPEVNRTTPNSKKDRPRSKKDHPKSKEDPPASKQDHPKSSPKVNRTTPKSKKDHRKK